MTSRLTRVCWISCAMLMPLAVMAQSDDPKPPTPIERLYVTHCASCHGEKMEGATGPSLMRPDVAWTDDEALLAQRILSAHSAEQSQTWRDAVPKREARHLSIWILQARG